MYNMKKRKKRVFDMATLKDVAERAGVSISTVSYVLNGKKTVRPDTLKRIEDAIEQLDYYPNLLASSLKTNRSKTVGVVVSDFQNLFFVDVLLSIESELGKYDYCMTICNSDNSPSKEKKCLQRLLSRNIDGLILIGTGESDFTNFKRVQLPLVCIDRISEHEFFTVRTDNVQGGVMGTQYLISRGYQKILFLGNHKYEFSKERYQGYEIAMKEAGLERYIKYRNIDALRMDAAYQETEKMLEEKEEFDAIFGCIDYFAIGAMNALIRHEINIPEQVGILGYDDIAPAKFTLPVLSSVAQSKQELGKVAVESLMKLLNNEKLDGKQILLMPKVVGRESC